MGMFSPHNKQHIEDIERYVCMFIMYNIMYTHAKRCCLDCLLDYFMLNQNVVMSVLKIGSVNIQGGASRKLSFNEVKNLVNMFDILCLQETWLTDSDSLNFSGYSIHRSDRKHNKIRHCGSGGVVTLYRTNLEKGLSKLNSQSNDLMWLKLDKIYFNTDNDIYLCNCYIPPQNSSVTQIDHIGDACSSFDILQKEVDLYDTKGDIALIGDFNSRTGNIQEVLHDITDMTHINRQEIILDNKIPNRRNEDLTVNQYGKHLLNVIEQAHMIILNGKSLGDLQGSKTCHKYNGSSTVDYMIVSSDIWNKVITFLVLENDSYTDHSPLACHIRMNNPWPSPVLVEKLMPTTKYIWGEDSRDKVTLPLTEPCFIDRLHNVTLMDDTNICTDTLTEILNDVAKISLVVTQIGNKKTPEKSPIDPKLVSMKRDFTRAKRHYYNNKLDNNRRIEFIKQRNKYKKIKYLTERYQKDDKLYKLAMIENT